MNKKILIYGALIVVAIWLLIRLFNIPEPEKTWSGNKVCAIFKDSIKEAKAEEPSEAEIYIDASYSIKPYFAADNSTATTTVSEFKNIHDGKALVYFIGNSTPYRGLVANIMMRDPFNGKTSTFHDFFKDAACKIDTTDVIVYLVTDGIMSIGRNADTSKALAELRGKITASLKGHKDLAGAIFRYTGGYKGPYFNCFDHKKPLTQEMNRPYYIIALGKTKHITWLQSKTADLNCPTGSLFMGLHNLDEHKKAVLTEGDICPIQYTDNDVVLTLDLPECLKNIDISKARPRLTQSNGDTIKAEFVKIGSTLQATINHNDEQVIDCDSYGKVRINLSIPNVCPTSWTGDWNCDKDEQGPDSTTTFGLKYLVNGIFNAFEKDSVLLSVDYSYTRQ